MSDTNCLYRYFTGELINVILIPVKRPILISIYSVSVIAARRTRKPERDHRVEHACRRCSCTEWLTGASAAQLAPTANTTSTARCIELTTRAIQTHWSCGRRQSYASSSKPTQTRLSGENCRSLYALQILCSPTNPCFTTINYVFILNDVFDFPVLKYHRTQSMPITIHQLNVTLYVNSDTKHTHNDNNTIDYDFVIMEHPDFSFFH